MSPTQRSLKKLRDTGFTAQVVERWNQFARIRQDFCGCIDVIGFRPDFGILGVQATSGSNHLARVKKSSLEPRLSVWLASGGLYEVWSYRKLKSQRSMVLRKTVFSLVDGILKWDDVDNIDKIKTEKE
jgi:hypothetical protein